VSSLITGLYGAILEAWQELRIHRTRVLLSLIGVAVAVCSLTTVVALGGLMQQANTELSERSGGRPATLNVSAYSTGTETLNDVRMQEAWSEALKRYDISYASRNLQSSKLIQFVDGAVPVQIQAVDQPYGTMHRVKITTGEWFSADDADLRAPVIVINAPFWDRLGQPDLATHPTVSLGGLNGTTAVIRGVYPASPWETEPAMYMLTDQLNRLNAETPVAADLSMGSMGYGGQAQYEMWVPKAISVELIPLLKRDISASLGDGFTVDVNRQDYEQYGDDPFLVTKLVVSGIAVLVLLLGALGLVNIALVTVKQRVREIGIRRSFGATAGRVFFAVMMESVVATVAAGVVGVMAAILLVSSPMVKDFAGQGMVNDFPPFPIDAAILGLVSATAVGALAGLLPALVAVRVKVIDAIRY
jgi:putative ABC transport system permease protein